MMRKLVNMSLFDSKEDVVMRKSWNAVAVFDSAKPTRNPECAVEICNAAFSIRKRSTTSSVFPLSTDDLIRFFLKLFRTSFHAAFFDENFSMT
jgi:hypothetical protein